MTARHKVLMACGLLLCGCPPPAGIRYPDLPRTADGALHVVTFDLGQANAMLLMYRGRTMLIDCGSPLRDPLRSSRVIPRRLDALLGHRRLDYFLVTHYHYDHVGGPAGRGGEPGGIYALIERDGITIDTLLDRGFWVAGKRGATQRYYEEATKEWLDRGVVKQRQAVRAGDHIDLAGLDVQIVAAAANGHLDRLASLFPAFVAGADPSENDYSVSVKVTLGDFELFNGGDLSGVSTIAQYGSHRLAYSDIESRVAQEVGSVEVYHVNHHGSRHSTNRCFAQVLWPTVSIVSSGHNSYGHPAPEVYDRLKRYGDVYITGGADTRVRSGVAADIVERDVEVLVAPDGARFWVNGTAYASLSDAHETARVGGRQRCYDGEIAPLTPQEYMVEPEANGLGNH